MNSLLLSFELLLALDRLPTFKTEESQPSNVPDIFQVIFSLLHGSVRNALNRERLVAIVDSWLVSGMWGMVDEGRWAAVGIFG